MSYHLFNRERSDILHSDGDIQHLTGYQLAISSALKLCHLYQTRDVPEQIRKQAIFF